MARMKSKKEESFLSEHLDHEVETPGKEEDGSLATFSKRRSRDLSEPKQSVKVELTESLAGWIHESIRTLEERGLSRSASDFVESHLAEITQDQVFKWTEKETPLEWRVNQCLQDPDKARFIKKLFDLDSSKSSDVLKTLDKMLEKKEKKSRTLPKKKKKIGIVPETTLIQSESKPENSLLS